MLNVVDNWIKATGINMTELSKMSKLSRPTLKSFFLSETADWAKERNAFIISSSCNLPLEFVMKFANYNGDVIYNVKNQPAKKKDPNAVKRPQGRPRKNQSITLEQVESMIKDLRTEIIGE